MPKRKRVLFVSESHQLASGFGTYADEVIPRLHATGKYELAEFACYGAPHTFQDTDWLIYGNAPTHNEPEYTKQHNENPAVQWGILRFEHVCLDFKPDIVITYRDPWMDAYIADSPFLPFFHWVWMPTIDSEPQKTEWLYTFNKCDGLMAYSEFGIRTLDKQTHGRVKPAGCASPAIDPNLFKIIPNKAKHKEQFGLPSNSIIFGTVMRNQKRKMFPELMKAFRQFLDQAPQDIAERSLLYLHTSYPEKQGWDITSLAHEYNIGSRLVCTYKCRACNQYFCTHYRDAITICNHCGNPAAIMPGVSSGIEHKDLINIYNLMDLYIQYAICEGFGMPQVEAAACGVPVVAIDYSAMSDIVATIKGYPVTPILEREMETNADRSKANSEELVKIFLAFAQQSDIIKKKQRLETRKLCINKYTWDNTAKAWERYLDQVETKNLEGQWNHPPLINPPPNQQPKNLSNHQFVEWVCNNLLQDPYHLFNYHMLNTLRNLNFGANIDIGVLTPCTQETVFKEAENIALRRFQFDAVRTNQAQAYPQPFIVEAHRRLKR